VALIGYFDDYFEERGAATVAQAIEFCRDFQYKYGGELT
jgi:hypothetical protein